MLLHPFLAETNQPLHYIKPRLNKPDGLREGGSEVVAAAEPLQIIFDVLVVRNCWNAALAFGFPAMRLLPEQRLLAAKHAAPLPTTRLIVRVYGYTLERYLMTTSQPTVKRSTSVRQASHAA